MLTRTANETLNLVIIPLIMIHIFPVRYTFQCMGFTAEMERDFVKEDLGPTLAKFGYSDVKLMMLDDARRYVQKWADTMLGDPQTAKYISGVALHWYNEEQTPAEVLTAMHKK